MKVLPTQPVILSENSVSYSWDKKSQNVHHFKVFEYKWRYNPTNSEGIERIYTFSQAALEKLLAHWNTKSKAWHYSI